jgi:hypothetical protein
MRLGAKGASTALYRGTFTKMGMGLRPLWVAYKECDTETLGRRGLHTKSARGRQDGRDLMQLRRWSPAIGF